ncbi:MAG: ABC transporter permease subunit [Melioribacteraceae bacterium]|nr:ABC transporter permease subunit [Melioribacteraceae bacterium]
MKNILILTQFTLREAFSRKIFIMFSGVTLFILAVAALIFSFVSVDDFQGMVNVNGSQLEIFDKIVEVLKLVIVVPLFGIGIFLAIFSTSSFIPHMLEKGSIDLLLSKPVSRSQVILGKYFGGIAVVFINIAFLILGSWFLIGIKFGNWDPSFLLTIPTIVFAFAELYSLLILIGIITQSSVLAMMLTYLIYFIISPILSYRDNIFSFIESKTTEYILETLYYVLPKTQDLSTINSELAAGGSVPDWMPVILAFTFIILTIATSITIFSKKDY